MPAEPSDIRRSAFLLIAAAAVAIAAAKTVGDRLKFIAALEATKNGFGGPNACKINFSAENHVGCLEGTMWKMVGDKIVNIGPTWRNVQ